jgi:GNAT superfamily N-acetyltransferase
MNPSLNFPPRRLDGADKPAILKHLLALSPEDRYSRFASTLSDSAIANYVEKIDFERDGGLGIIDSAGTLVAFIHLARHWHKAELGASVRLAARHQGYARDLFKIALNEAELLGIRRVHLATGHPAALRIAQGLGFRLKTSPIMPRASILMPALESRLERLLCG